MFNKNEINTGRQFEFDVAKTFAIFFMIIVHVFDHMTSGNKSVVSYIVEFLGCPPAACIFMFTMGIGMVYTRHNTTKNFITRGIKLFIVAYVLNFLRETLPLLIASLLNIKNDYSDKSLFGTFAVVDILQFAGLAFIIIALMKKIGMKPWMILCTAVVFNAAGSLCNGIFDDTSEIVQYTAELFFFTNPDTAFPVLQWLIYPAAGICFGSMFKHVSDKRLFYRNMLIIGVAALFFVTAGCFFYDISITDFFMTDAYFMQNYLTLLWCMSIITVFIPLYFYLSGIIKGRMADTVKFFSANLNTIYIIQWIVISYLIIIMQLLSIPLLPAVWGIPTGIMVCVLCVGVAAAYVGIKTHFINKREIIA